MKLSQQNIDSSNKKTEENRRKPWKKDWVTELTHSRTALYELEVKLILRRGFRQQPTAELADWNKSTNINEHEWTSMNINELGLTQVGLSDVTE